MIFFSNDNFKDLCLAYCDTHQINKIEGEKEKLRRCIKVTEDGVEITKKGRTMGKIYPALKDHRFNFAASKKLGKYRMSCGKIVFVYRDGETYIGDWDIILSKLNLANFQVGRDDYFDNLPNVF